LASSEPSGRRTKWTQSHSTPMKLKKTSLSLYESRKCHFISENLFFLLDYIIIVKTRHWQWPTGWTYIFTLVSNHGRRTHSTSMLSEVRERNLLVRWVSSVPNPRPSALNGNALFVNQRDAANCYNMQFSSVCFLSVCFQGRGWSWYQWILFSPCHHRLSWPQLQIVSFTSPCWFSITVSGAEPYSVTSSETPDRSNLMRQPSPQLLRIGRAPRKKG
jgi:hypothetical protein